jgi:tRNA/rRNA methyltransferase
MADFRDRLCIVLVRTQGPINLGGVARLCGNLGIEDLRLVDPLCDPNSDEARKFANHRRDFLLAAPVFPDLSAALHDVSLAIGTSARDRDEEFGPAVGLDALPGLIGERGTAKIALVFGNEADGLSNEELLACHHRLHLETPGDYPSYNLSHAVAITAHHLCVDITEVPAPSAGTLDDAAIGSTVDRLGTYWLDSLERFNYFRRTNRSRFEPQFRLLLKRLRLNERDATTLFGTLAQFNYFAFGDKGSQGTEQQADASDIGPTE